MIYNSDNIDQDVHDEKASSVSTSQKAQERKLSVEFFGTDLVDEAKNNRLDPVIWRNKETDQLMFTLLRKTKSNPVLIGEAGVGKTAIVEWLAQRISTWDVPEKLKNKRIMMIDMWSLIAGTKYRGEFESRMKAILDEACDPGLGIILFIDELHTIMWAWWPDGSASDTANLLKPLLARWKIKIIWATTHDEYQKYIEKDAALKRRFQEIIVDEPSVDDAVQIIQWLRSRFEDYHDVVIDDDAVTHAVYLSKRHIMNKYLPDKAIDLIDEACARMSTLTTKLEHNQEYVDLEATLHDLHEHIEKCVIDQDYFHAAELKKQEVLIKLRLSDMRSHQTLPKSLRPHITAEQIWHVVAEKIGIPTHVITESEIAKIKRLEHDLSQHLIWQDAVIQQVTKAIKRSRLWAHPKNKPIASFLFLGPSWVGKTFTAKLIAEHYFADPRALIRIDMSDLMERHSVSKLIWSAPGYVWYDEWWGLTEQVRRKPYSVILFDEIEKASPDVLNIMLQILDEWYLKDNKWRMVDFKHTIIIMTSNIWSEFFSQQWKKIWFVSSTNDIVYDEVSKLIMDKLKTVFTPERLNRIDYKIVFQWLGMKELSKIFKIHYGQLLWWRKDKSIPFKNYDDQELEALIKEKMYDPQYGARPIEQYMNILEDEFIEHMMHADA